MRAPLRHLLVVAISFGTALATLAAINYAIDVNGVYHATDKVRQNFATTYVRRLKAAPYGLASVSYERAIKLELARTSTTDCFVLGSSRMLTVNLQTMPLLGSHCRALTNLAMTDGGLEDFITLAAEVFSHGAPRQLVIGFEPWILKYNVGVFWTQLVDRYDAARRYLGLAPRSAGSDLAGKVINLVSADYLEKNLHQLWSRSGRILPQIVEVSPSREGVGPDDDVTLPDGSVTYSPSVLSKVPLSDEEVTSEPQKIFPPFINAAAARDFDQLLDNARRRDIAVVFVLIPLHPKVLRCAASYICEGLATMEAEARRIATARGIPIIGSYDPARSHLTENDFTSTVHIVPNSLMKLIERNPP